MSFNLALQSSSHSAGRFHLVRLITASLHIQPSAGCDVDLDVNLKLVNGNLKGGLSDPRFGVEGTLGAGIGQGAPH